MSKIKNKKANLSNPVAKEYFDIIYNAIDGKYDDTYDLINLTVALTMMIQAVQEDIQEKFSDYSTILDDTEDYSYEFELKQKRRNS